MRQRVAIVAGPQLAELVGLDGRFAGGEARLLQPGTDLGAFDPDVAVALGDATAEGPPGVPLVRWLDGDPPGSATPGERLVAPGGTALWRRAPLPAADQLFELPASPSAEALLVGGDREARARLVLRLEEIGVTAQSAAALTREGLLHAGVVAFVGVPGAPLPALAPAVLAARRVLVAPRAEPVFGLLPGIDHVAYDDEDELARLVDLVTTRAEAFEGMIAMGTLAAEAHRASTVYGRLAIDIALERAAATAAPRSAELRD